MFVPREKRCNISGLCRLFVKRNPSDLSDCVKLDRLGNPDMNLIVFAPAQEKVPGGRVQFCFMWGDLDWLLTGVLTMVVPRVTQKQERRLIGTNDPVLALSSDLFDTLHLTSSTGVTRRNVACLKLATFFLSYTSYMIRQQRNTLQCGKVLKLPRMSGTGWVNWCQPAGNPNGGTLVPEQISLSN